MLDNLHRGSEYRLQCVMEHELHHMMHKMHHGPRRLADMGETVFFDTLSAAGWSGLCE